ncbi:hypothetical protein BLOT_005571 [Blomia tropicalis]|nr:hypothetical protein BLOT_005571 [Blomia tropicalis]
MNLTENEFYEKWVGTSFNSYMLVWNEWVGTKGTGGDPIVFVTKFSRDVCRVSFDDKEYNMNHKPKKNNKQKHQNISD